LPWLTRRDLLANLMLDPMSTIEPVVQGRKRREQQNRIEGIGFRRHWVLSPRRTIETEILKISQI